MNVDAIVTMKPGVRDERLNYDLSGKPFRVKAIEGDTLVLTPTDACLDYVTVCQWVLGEVGELHIARSQVDE